MALSYTEITLGSGSGENGNTGTVFGPFTFEYLNTDDIKVQVRAAAGTTWTSHAIASDGVNTTTKKVTLASALGSSAASDVLRIYRSSSLEALVDFQNGSRLSEADLDSAYRQGLFAAQEAAEDAPGSGGVTMQTSETITDGAITAAKLASTLNLSSKTLTLPEASVTTHVPAGVPSLATGYSGVLPTNRGGTGSANTNYCNLASNVTGTLPVANGGTGRTVDYAPGQVIEEFLLPCDGIGYVAKSGTYTPTAVTSGVDLTDTYAEISGSSINYTPPTGTKLIIYKFVFGVHAGDDGGLHHKIELGGVDVNDSRCTVMFQDYMDYGRVTIEWPFVIGDTANAATGRHDAFSDWSSGLVIRVLARRYSNTFNASLHGTHFHDGGTADVFNRPLVGIKAIG